MWGGYRNCALYVDVSSHSLELAVVAQLNDSVLLLGQIVECAVVLGSLVGSRDFAFYAFT